MEAMNEKIANLERLCGTLGTKVEELLTAKENQDEIIRSMKTQILDLQKTVEQLRPASLRKDESVEGEEYSRPSQAFKPQSNTTHIWQLKNYPVLKQAEVADPSIWQQSPPFYLGDCGYKLRLEVALTGKGTGRGKTMAVALYLVRGENDSSLPWPMRNVIKLSVLEHSGQHNHKSVLIPPQLDNACKIQPWCRPRGSVNPCMFSTESFLEIDMVESYGSSSKFLSNNSLYFELELMKRLEDPCPNLPDLWQPVTNNLMISAQGENILLTNTSTDGIDPRLFTLPIPLNRHRNYFEVRIIHLPENNPDSSVAVGVCPADDLGKRTMPGWKTNSSGFHSDDGKLFLGKGTGDPFGPISGITDILGCGLKLDSFPSLDTTYGKRNDAVVEVFFTINNVRIGESFEMRYPPGGLVPAVGLNFRNVAVEVYEPYYRHFEDFVIMPRI